MRSVIPILLSALLVAGIAGCGSSGPTTPGTTVAGGVDLDDEYGGFTFEDELPAFGEPSLFADQLLAEDGDYEDAFADDTTVVGFRGNHGSRIFTLRICWGRLMRLGDADSLGCGDREMLYDWDGALSIDRGAIILKRTILFDPEDYIHVREDRRTLEWTSKTSPHYDGILVQIIDPPAPGRDSTEVGAGPGIAPNRVTFRTPLYSRTFSMDELAAISEVIPINRCGIMVSFDGFAEPSGLCPHGFLAGIWRHAPPDTTVPQPPVPPDTTFNFAAVDTVTRSPEVRGYFYGNWIQANGALAGRLRGVYGINSQGRRVFFGKYIDLSGHFKGILRGTYGSMSMGPFMETAGYFDGDWINERRTVHGHLGGNWVAGTSDAPGTFRGKWRTDCRN
jgi:hypothetical protein